jgi:hypothetical protein
MNERISSPETSTGDKESEIIAKMARPDIYRINAFRVLQVPVTASARDISSRLRKLEIIEKFEGKGQTESSILPLIPAADIDARRQAEQRLTDPESRLIDELFWFWPLQPGVREEADEALVAMKRGDLDGAVSIWKRHEVQSSEANVSMHNLAIMFHALALDIEHEAQTQPLSTRQIQQKQAYWELSFSRWKILLKHEGFWQRLGQRIHEFDDPRLTTGTARRIRSGLPLVLTLIIASLAVRAAEKGSEYDISYHIDLMRKSGFEAAIVDEALRLSIIPIRDQVKIICANAATEADKAPENADKVASNLIGQTARLLSALDTLLAKTHPTREAAHDETAQQIVNCLVAFCKRTENWSVTLSLLQQALQISVSDSVRKRIEEIIQTVKGNLQYGTCWFCKLRPSKEDAIAEVKMYGNVSRTSTFTGTRIQYQNMTVRVPRCAICKSAHTTQSNYRTLGAALGFLTGLGTCIGVTQASNGWIGFGTLVALAGTGYAIGYWIGRSRTPRETEPESHKKDFPTVTEMKSLGWSIGDKPS